MNYSESGAVSSPAVPMVQVVKLEKRFTEGSSLEIRLLHGMNFEISSGECIEIAGRNGSGKSTLLRIVAGLDEATSGEVLMQSRALDLAFLAQSLSEYCGRSLTVCEQISFGRFVRSNGERRPFWNLMGDRARKRAHRLLRPLNLELENRVDTFMGQLSGGQQQAVMLASIIGETPPDLLLLDEHSTALDTVAQRAVIGVLEDLLAGGSAIVFVSHRKEDPIRTLRTKLISVPEAQINHVKKQNSTE